MMKTKSLDSLINSTHEPRCSICGYLLAKPLKKDKQCPNCLANARIVAGYVKHSK
jgi:rubrerythrin